MAPDQRTAIEIRGLTKSYGRRGSPGEIRAVRGIDVSVASGSLFAFLGTNGAGKSTTIGCVTTVQRPDAGEIEVDGLRVGRDDDAVRRSIGVVFQSSLLDPLLSVRENLTLRGRFYGLGADRIRARIGELAELVEIEAFLDRRYARLSGGQKRRADIARALVHDPAVLFLDEPTAGLDPQSREQVWAAIDGLRVTRDTTVFLTTHYMAETERADAVCIIDEGRIVAHGTPSGLRRDHSSSVLTLTAADRPAVEDALRRRDLAATWDGVLARVPVPDSDTARELLGVLGPAAGDFEFRHGTMDDVFLALTRKRPEP